MLLNFRRKWGQPSIRFISRTKVENEIERKFIPNKSTIKKCQELAFNKKIKTFVDTYYDNNSFQLTTKDIWLRKRNSAFELKWPIEDAFVSDSDHSFKGVDYYHESTELDIIKKVLISLAQIRLHHDDCGKLNESEMQNLLQRSDLKPFAQIETQRTRYELHMTSSLVSRNSVVHKFYVDIDSVKYININNTAVSNSYNIGEIELIEVANGLSANDIISDIFNQLEIDSQTVPGKVLVYLSRFAPQHFKALEACGLVSSKLGPKKCFPPQTPSNCAVDDEGKILSGTAVNFHFTRKCNFECKFCFHAAHTSSILPREQRMSVLQQLYDEGAEKINFAGGEPFLPSYHDILGEMVQQAKQIGFSSVSVITNNSHVTAEWFAKYGRFLDILGISCDSLDAVTNFRHGRHPAGSRRALSSEVMVSRLRSSAQLCRDYGVMLKINTVVTSINYLEVMSDVINCLRPMRWKVFQVLPLEGENHGQHCGKKQNVLPLVVSEEQFEYFVRRNAVALWDPSIMKPENNRLMQASYLLVDEQGRFLDASLGKKSPTRSIAEVGVRQAFRELVSSSGGGFHRDEFLERGGYYAADWTRKG